ncbi:MAG: SPOR domain-containing protein [Stellaceae bacterium]
MAFALGPMRPDDRRGRIFIKRRPRRVFVIVLALLAMLGASGAFFALYHAMTRTGAPEDVPVLRADTQPTRHRPDNPGGMDIPGQGTMVLDGGHGEPKTEQLLPPPEAPLPRPATADDQPPPAAPPPPSPATPAAAPPPAPVVAAPPAPIVAAAPPPAAAREPPAKALAPVVAAAPPPAPPAAAGKFYRLQLAAVRSPEAAKQEWERLKRLHGDVLGNLSLSAERVDLGERGIFYRIQVGPIADAAKAEQQCGELKRRGVSCLLVRR